MEMLKRGSTEFFFFHRELAGGVIGVSIVTVSLATGTCGLIISPFDMMLIITQE